MANSDETSTKLTWLSGVSNLRSPGTDLNYLDWELKMELVLKNISLSYVLQHTLLKYCTAAWEKDNKKVCAPISWDVDDINIRYIKPFKRDASGMWGSLKNSHN